MKRRILSVELEPDLDDWTRQYCLDWGLTRRELVEMALSGWREHSFTKQELQTEVNGLDEVVRSTLKDGVTQ